MCLNKYPVKVKKWHIFVENTLSPLILGDGSNWSNAAIISCHVFFLRINKFYSYVQLPLISTCLNLPAYNSVVVSYFPIIFLQSQDKSYRGFRQAAVLNQFRSI